jgi:hypothetical protein
MAFNPSPTGYFPGIVTLSSGNSVSTSGVFIPYSDLESYNVSTSGDIRQLIYSFNEAVTDEYVTLATADRPNQISILRSASVPDDNTIRKVYTITVNLAFSGLSVRDE